MAEPQLESITPWWHIALFLIIAVSLIMAISAWLGPEELPHAFQMQERIPSFPPPLTRLVMEHYEIAIWVAVVLMAVLLVREMQYPRKP